MSIDRQKGWNLGVVAFMQQCIGVVINVATYMVQIMNRSAAKLKRLARTTARGRGFHFTLCHKVTREQAENNNSLRSEA
jgi:hypothetical protein